MKRLSEEPTIGNQRTFLRSDPAAAEASVEKQRLTEAFIDFAERNGLNLGLNPATWFYKRLMERYPNLVQAQRRVVGERVRYINGLRLKPRPPED